MRRETSRDVPGGRCGGMRHYCKVLEKETRERELCCGTLTDGSCEGES